MRFTTLCTRVCIGCFFCENRASHSMVLKIVKVWCKKIQAKMRGWLRLLGLKYVHQVDSTLQNFQSAEQTGSSPRMQVLVEYILVVRGILEIVVVLMRVLLAMVNFVAMLLLLIRYQRLVVMHHDNTLGRTKLDMQHKTTAQESQMRPGIFWGCHK